MKKFSLFEFQSFSVFCYVVGKFGLLFIFLFGSFAFIFSWALSLQFDNLIGVIIKVCQVPNAWRFISNDEFLLKNQNHDGGVNFIAVAASFVVVVVVYPLENLILIQEAITTMTMKIRPTFNKV